MASVVDPTHTQPVTRRQIDAEAWLEQGERLDRETFHARYSAMPTGTRAELIRGAVHMPSPLHIRHGRMDPQIQGWLRDYCMGTPGVEVLAGVTTLLGPDSEVQPDAALLTVAGSNVREPLPEDGFVHGAPELVVEIAMSTAPFDLFEKKELYERYGVQEYVVVLVREPTEVLWFVRRGDKFEKLELGGDGFFRSEVFPGLWLDPAALVQRNAARVREVVEQGLATAEHADFVQQLESAQAG